MAGPLLEQWMDAKKIKFPPVMEKPYKEVRENLVSKLIGEIPYENRGGGAPDAVLLASPKANCFRGFPGFCKPAGPL